MRRRALPWLMAVLAGLLLLGTTTMAGGLYLAVPVVSLDLTTAWSRLPLAAESAFDILIASLVDAGVPAGELLGIEQGFADALSMIEGVAGSGPSWIPLPLLGGGVEFRLPLVVIDGLRLSGGVITDRTIRSLTRALGQEIPQPLMDLEIEIGTETARLTADVAFSAWTMSTEVVKRFDFLVFALNLGAGMDLMGGRVVPAVNPTGLPTMLVPGVDSALAALHLDELSWSAFAVHGMLGLELGLPFLRLYGDVRWTLPVSVREAWWGVRPASISAMVGLVIRF